MGQHTNKTRARRFSGRWKSFQGVLHVLIILLSHLGPGRIIRNMLGWSLEEKNVVGSGVWLFRGALQGKNLFPSLDVTGGWVKNGSYHTAWAVPCGSLCTLFIFVWAGPRYKATHMDGQCWPLLEGVWRAIAPLMRPWCAEGGGAYRREPEPLPGEGTRVLVGIVMTNFCLESPVKPSSSFR